MEQIGAHLHMYTPWSAYSQREKYFHPNYLLETSLKMHSFILQTEKYPFILYYLDLSFASYLQLLLFLPPQTSVPSLSTPPSTSPTSLLPQINSSSTSLQIKK